ncbi:MAG: response regulator [Desulfosarcina sp.]
MNQILVIDDEPGISDMIGEALTRFGYTVEIATTGQQGVKRLKDASFDLVVTDMCMPGLDGTGIIRQIRNSSRPLTPVIGISGTPWLLERADCDAVLTKPFPLHVLIDTVKRLERINLPAAADPAACGPPLGVPTML